MDGCVLLAPRDYFAGLQAKIHQLPLTRRNARALRRHSFAHATTAAPDAQCRIWVPPQLRAFAQLDHQVVLVGNDAYLELWNPDLWDQVRRDMETQQQDEDWLIPGI